MTKDLPKEVKEAVDLLEEFEISDSCVKSARCFKDGISMLSDYLEEYPDTPHTQYINNIKISYTRALLRKLKDCTEWDDWIDILLATLEVRDEIEEILASDPLLRNEYDKFLALWKDELIEALKLIRK